METIHGIAAGEDAVMLYVLQRLGAAASAAAE